MKPSDSLARRHERTMRAGMNVARLNLAHVNGEETCARIDRNRETALRAGQRVAVSSLAGAPRRGTTRTGRPIERSDEFRNGQDRVGGDGPAPSPEPEPSSGRIDPSGPPRWPIREDEEDP